MHLKLFSKSVSSDAKRGARGVSSLVRIAGMLHASLSLPLRQRFPRYIPDPQDMWYGTLSFASLKVSYKQRWSFKFRFAYTVLEVASSGPFLSSLQTDLAENLVRSFDLGRGQIFTKCQPYLFTDTTFGKMQKPKFKRPPLKTNSRPKVGLNPRRHNTTDFTSTQIYWGKKWAPWAQVVVGR